jgi:flagella basal body P-ring formation protein FlgA
MRAAPPRSTLPVSPTTALLLAAWLAPGLAVPRPAAASESVRQFVQSQMPGGTGRVEVSLGTLNPRLQLAPCQRVEPYLLPGTRLWGRSAIGVRCVEGADWAVALPVTVTVWGKALVATQPLAAGTPLDASLLREQEVELTREAGTPVTEPAQLVGKALQRPLAAGQALRLEHLRVAQTVAAGDPVRVQLVGPGFSVMAEGQALSGAGEGQAVKVRTENGRILAGTLRGRTVEARL